MTVWPAEPVQEARAGRGIDAVRRFLENAVISFRALYRWFTPSSYLATKIITPIEAMVVFGLLARYAGGAGTFQYMVIGNCLAQICLGSLATANTVAEERGLGTLPLLLASPANRLVNFLQRGTVHILDSLVTASLALCVAALVFGVDFGATNWVAVVAAIAVATLSTICMGLLLGTLALAYSNFFLVLNLLWLLILLVTGVNVPVSALPSWISWLSEVLPFTRSLRAAREAIAGAPLSRVIGGLVTELGLAALYLSLGYCFLLLLERLVKRRGTYELT
jgi:ABC-2 type transport system permease protein